MERNFIIVVQSVNNTEAIPQIAVTSRTFWESNNLEMEIVNTIERHVTDTGLGDYTVSVRFIDA
jgi:hypothetical protein